MAQDLLQWSDSTVGYSRALFLLFMAVLQAAATRPFVQVSQPARSSNSLPERGIAIYSQKLFSTEQYDFCHNMV